MKLVYHQLNVREIKKEILKIKNISSDFNNILVGLEITIPEISKLLTINVDPQHTWLGFDHFKKTTCLEKIQEILPIFSQFKSKRIHIFFLKTDLDSISSAAILDIYFNTDIKFNNSIIERINAISAYDRHGRDDLNEQPPIKIPRGLFMFVSGWKNGLLEKIKMTKNWILYETFDNIHQYNKIAFNNFKEFVFSSKIELVIPKKVVFVRSTRRGACGLGYKFAPIVLALNPSYRFGFGSSRLYGKKWIIAQYNDGYIDMQKLLLELKKIEPNWGGSSTIIGSPQDKPSKILKDEVIKIVKKILV